jgi:hypothetical protein
MKSRGRIRYNGNESEPKDLNSIANKGARKTYHAATHAQMEPKVPNVAKTPMYIPTFMLG